LSLLRPTTPPKQTTAAKEPVSTTLKSSNVGKMLRNAKKVIWVCSTISHQKQIRSLQKNDSKQTCAQDIGYFMQARQTKDMLERERESESE
jgi:hypothetical protein